MYTYIYAIDNTKSNDTFICAKAECMHLYKI